LYLSKWMASPWMLSPWKEKEWKMGEEEWEEGEEEQMGLGMGMNVGWLSSDPW
jgi:hypothetical protein